MTAAHPYLVFDFETTGLSPQNDRIVQVGLCDVVGGQVVDQKSWLVNQDMEIPEGASNIHCITTADIRATGIRPHDSLSALFEAMRKAPTCMGHNIHRFDIGFMLAEAKRLGLEAPDSRDFIDTAALFKGWKLGMPKDPHETHCDYANRVLSIPVRGLKYSVTACIDELGIKTSVADLHGAGKDTYATHLVFQAMNRHI